MCVRRLKRADEIETHEAQAASDENAPFGVGHLRRLIFWGSADEVISRTEYVGCCIVRACMRARYSPMMPSENSCAPEKIAIIEARKEKPGTPPPWIRYLTITKMSAAMPNRVSKNPIKLESCSGSVLKPVIMLTACTTSFRNV